METAFLALSAQTPGCRWLKGAQRILRRVLGPSYTGTFPCLVYSLPAMDRVHQPAGFNDDMPQRRVAQTVDRTLKTELSDCSATTGNDASQRS